MRGQQEFLYILFTRCFKQMVRNENRYQSRKLLFQYSLRCSLVEATLIANHRAAICAQAEKLYCSTSYTSALVTFNTPKIIQYKITHTKIEPYLPLFETSTCESYIALNDFKNKIQSFVQIYKRNAKNRISICFQALAKLMYEGKDYLT